MKRISVAANLEENESVGHHPPRATDLRGRLREHHLLVCERCADRVLDTEPEPAVAFRKKRPLVVVQGPRTRAVEASLAAGARLALAETHRLQGNLDSADEILQSVPSLLSTCGDPFEEARYCHALGLLRQDQKRLQEAIALLERAIDLYSTLGEDLREAETLLGVADLYFESLDLPRALEAFVATALAAPADLPLPARIHSLRGGAWCLAVLQGPERALAFLARARAGFELPAESYAGFAIQSIEAEVLLAHGAIDEARRGFLAALPGLLDHGETLEAASAAAGLLHALAEEPDDAPLSDEVRQSIERLLDAAKDEPEVFEALRALYRALAFDAPTPALLERLTQHIQRALARSIQRPVARHEPGKPN